MPPKNRATSSSRRSTASRVVARVEQDVQSVTDFLERVRAAFKDTSWPEAIGRAVPWAGAIIESAAETLGPVRFVMSLLGKLGGPVDVDRLTTLACSLAYQRALEHALLEAGRPDGTQLEPALSFAERRDSESEHQTFDMETFSFRYALLHPFTRRQDRHVELYACGFGFQSATRRALIASIHERFTTELKDLLSAPELKERFEPVRRRMELGNEEAVAHAWLAGHRAWLRRQYAELPVLGREPFSLADVYVETECGQLSWKQISRDGHRREDRCDPFRDATGGRSPLIETVVKRLAEPGFRDAIVVQGVAGAGKSAFTLRLANVLMDQGLRPIRIRIRDLRRFEHDIYQALGEAIRVDEPENVEGLVPPRDPLLDGAIFDSSVPFGAASISPHVLILDGWDELTIAGTRSFRDRLKELLHRLRDGLLRRGHRPPIRLVLTGRPSPDLEGSAFLLDETPILTLRSIQPSQLQQYAANLAKALATHRGEIEGWVPWQLNIAECAPAFLAYRRWFERMIDNDERLAAHDNRESSGIDVLGLPLLALLAFRLLAEWKGAPAELWDRPTALYRSLIDVTVRHAGKGADEGLQQGQVVHIVGDGLRHLLRRTAAAITAHGVEAIPFRELELRLDDNSLEKRVADHTESSALHALVVAFYFKGGHPELGCEFLHKSFREYLFAEEIVETVKLYAQQSSEQIRTHSDWWRDFDSGGAMRDFSRALGRLLGPHWMTPEVRGHLRALLEWEIGRASGTQPESLSAAHATAMLDLSQWERARDMLALIWEWWADGVHLRMQPSRARRGRHIEYHTPYVLDLIEHWVVPQTEGDELAAVPRTTTIDAHMGDGLFELNASLHYAVARARGWDGDWTGSTSLGAYQTKAARGDVVLFRPGGRHYEYFGNLAARINAAGFRPHWPFPGGTDSRGIDFSGARLWGAAFMESDLRFACFRSASLAQAILYATLLQSADLTEAELEGADTRDAQAEGIILAGIRASTALNRLRRAALNAKKVS